MQTDTLNCMWGERFAFDNVELVRQVKSLYNNTLSSLSLSLSHTPSFTLSSLVSLSSRSLPTVIVPPYHLQHMLKMIITVQHFHFNTLTSTLSLQHSHFNTLTSTLSLQHSLTSTLSLQHSHFNTLTATLSPGIQSHTLHPISSTQTPDEFDRENLYIDVYDANTLFRNKLIGRYAFGLSKIHKQKEVSHQMKDKWTILVDPEQPRYTYPNKRLYYLALHVAQSCSCAD